MNEHTPTSGTTPTPGTTSTRRDRGQVAIEYLGFLPLLLLCALLAIQAGLAAYAANQAGTGARAAARSGSMSAFGGCDVQAGKDAMSDWTAKRARIRTSGSGEDVTCTARVKVPDILPGVNIWSTAERSSTMPRT
ncbi:TadE/TadG family type IV pilus assembly protein [Streptomyces sp. NPDC057748]|uniref:TadE/TadG family type IV pilus assembly protein n=1 Tax=unclassified Streptomyces TaxID=2593676 RepID=UPI0036A5586D